MFVLFVHSGASGEHYFCHVSFTSKLQIFDSIFFLKQFQLTSIFGYYTVFDPSECLVLNVIYLAYPVS